MKKGWDIEPDEVERALGLSLAWMVPNDFKAAIAAINFGEPVCLRTPKSEMSTSLVGLAEMLNGRAEAGPPRPPERRPNHTDRRSDAHGPVHPTNTTAATIDPPAAKPEVTVPPPPPPPPPPRPPPPPGPAGRTCSRPRPPPPPTAARRRPGRRQAGRRPAATPAPAAAPVSHERQVYLQGLKAKIHHKLVERLDTQTLRTMPPEQVRNEVRVLVRELCQSEKGLINTADQEKLMDDVMDETFGLGPLEILLKDPTISDILVNRWDRIFCERRGRLDLSEVTFRDNAHLRQIIDRIVGRIGRRVDETSPMVDARLADGSRVNAIIPPLALDGPAMSIRRFGSKPLRSRT